MTAVDLLGNFSEGPVWMVLLEGNSFKTKFGKRTGGPDHAQTDVGPAAHCKVKVHTLQVLPADH